MHDYMQHMTQLWCGGNLLQLPSLISLSRIVFILQKVPIMFFKSLSHLIGVTSIRETIFINIGQ